MGGLVTSSVVFAGADNDRTLPIVVVSRVRRKLKSEVHYKERVSVSTLALVFAR